MRQNYLIIGLVLASLLLVVWKNRKPPRKIASAVALSEQNVSQGQKAVSSQVPQLSHAETGQIVYTALLKKNALPVENGEMKFELSAKVSRTCYPGDGNAIQLDMKEMPAKKLIVTLERMERGLTISQMELPKSFFIGGDMKINISLPTPSKPELYGLYVCLTSSDSGGCQGKKARDINEIFTQHMNRKLLVLEDRLYFFQLLVADGSGLAAFSIHPKGKQAFEALSKILYSPETMGTGGRNSIDRARDLTHTLGSLPVHFSEKQVAILLPLYDAQACSQQLVSK